MIDINKLYEKSMRMHGEEAQFKMLAEECCELAQVALKYHRSVNPSTPEELAEEMADVEIMIGQVKHCFGLNKAVVIKKQEKLKRLKGILEDMK